MEKELEVKILDIDKDALEIKLISVGAKLIKKELQINSIYDYENSSFEKEKKGYIRIRESKNIITEEEYVEFTIKKIISTSEVREYEEINTRVDNKTSLEKILNELNLYLKHRGTKERTRYRYKNINYDIDVWDKKTVAYPYLEIEIINKEDLGEALSLIGYTKNDISLKTISQLKKEYEEERNVR